MALFNYVRANTFSSSDGILAIYSVTKVNAAYTGACIRLRDETADTETDIGFLNGILDYAAADTYLNGHIGRVATIYDQSGNGLHATQTTEANMAFYRTANAATSGLPSIYFNRRSGDLDHFYNISINTDSNDLAWTGVAQGGMSFFPGTASTDVLVYTGGNPSFIILSDNTVFRSSTRSMLFASGDSAPMKAAQQLQFGVKLRSGVGATYYYDSFASETLTALSTQRVNTTALLGKRSNGTNKMLGAFQELVVYTSSLSAPNEVKLKADQRHAFKLINKKYIVLCVGHSKIFGYTSTNAFNEPFENSPPSKLAQMLGPEYVVYSFGIPSATIQSIQAANIYGTIKRMLLDHSGLIPIIVFLDPGNNIGTDNYATLTGRIDSFVADVRATAPDARFVFPTITSRGTYAASAPLEQLRLDINTYLRDNYNNPDEKNYVSDFIDNAFIGPADSYENTTYMDVDEIHFVTNGNIQVATELTKTIITVR